VLLNPIVHLQRSLQESLPSVVFWDNSQRSETTVRKIAYEFFQMEKTRCFMWGEPPFRESCDMLAPEALGFLTCNKDQWDLRTFDLHERVGALSDAGSMSRDGKLMAPPGYQYRSLRQFSVWGEQPNPEETERMMLEENTNVYIADTGHIHHRADKDFEAGKVTKDGEEKKKTKKKKDAALARLALEQVELHPLADPGASCLRAACLDESFNPPPKDMPPTWMKMAAIAPAPRVIGADPPLKPPEVPGFGTAEGFYTSATSFGRSQMGGFAPQARGSSGMNQTGGGGFATQGSFGMNQTGQSNSKRQSQVKFR